MSIDKYNNAYETNNYIDQFFRITSNMSTSFLLGGGER